MSFVLKMTYYEFHAEIFSGEIFFFLNFTKTHMLSSKNCRTKFDEIKTKLYPVLGKCKKDLFFHDLQPNVIGQIKG